MIATAETLAQTTGVSAACAALAVPRSMLYRQRRPAPPAARRATPWPAQQRALSAVERATMRDTLNSPAYADRAPREVYAALLEQGTYLCSVATMYRILRAYGEVRERRDQLRHPAYAAPELLATAPNQVWTWDITRLLGPHKWTYFYLYVVLDLFSRKVVGWLLAGQDSAALAEELVAETCAREGIARQQLTLHADRGGPMIAHSLALLLTNLGVDQSHSRPHVSNDNPYSEAQFKTLKYAPGFPKAFGSLADARAWCQSFFAWYNHAHHHTGLGLLTPAVVHAGQAAAVQAQRQMVLTQAYATHSARFVKGRPVPPPLPTAAWINPPKSTPPATPIQEGFPPPMAV